MNQLQSRLDFTRTGSLFPYDKQQDILILSIQTSSRCLPLYTMQALIDIMQTSNNCQCVCIPSFSSENIFCHRISVQQTAVVLSCFFQLSRYLPFLYYTTMTTGHYNLLPICIITFFNVIIVFLNKITNHTVPIFNFLSNENNSSILH